jgi:hypothetical protein
MAQVMVRRFKNFHTSDEMEGTEGKEEVGNSGREHESVSSEYEIDDGHHVNNEAKKDKENNLK